jgi:hypothetical protein
LQLLNVGRDLYVEFEERFGDKEFLRHVWDTSASPFKAGDIDNHEILLRVTIKDGAVHFPVVRRVRGSNYVPTGKHVTWNHLHTLNASFLKPPVRVGGTEGRGEEEADLLLCSLPSTSLRRTIPLQS